MNSMKQQNNTCNENMYKEYVRGEKKGGKVF